MKWLLPILLAVVLVVIVVTGIPRNLDLAEDIFKDSPLYIDNEPKQWVASSTVKILFIGDVMFDRGVATHTDKYGLDVLFAGVEHLFMENDAIVGNLEGTITTQESVARKNNKILRFTFDPKFADLLKRMNFTAVSLANNHTLDFYDSGFQETKKYLAEQGILFFGSPLNNGELSTSFVRDGKTICLVGYHDLYVQNEMTVITEIQKIRPTCTYIVVLPHWGDEYKDVQSERQTELAHTFIDAGADLIIGAHPHVVQPLEIYKNKAIFYSLGNFVFDQWFSFDTEHGLAVIVELSDEKVTFVLVPTTSIKGEVTVSSPEEGNKVIQRLSVDSISENKFMLYLP